MASETKIHLTFHDPRSGERHGISQNVCGPDGEDVSLSHLHKAVTVIQQDANAVLTRLVEKEREITSNEKENHTQSCSDGEEEDGDDDDDDQDETVEPPGKMQKR